MPELENASAPIFSTADKSQVARDMHPENTFVPISFTDEQLKLIADKGGIIGLCFFPGFLGGDTFQKIYENIYHMLELGLENHIAIGSDFDGADMDSRLENIGDIPSLYFRLSEKGISDRVLNKIFYENAAKYMLNL